MSYAIIRIQKMTIGTVKGIQIHDQREKEYSHTNSDIDFSKSHLNEDLQNKENINFNHKVKERIQELQLPKAVRKDAIVMCQCLVTSDKQFFDKMSPVEQKKFFEDSFKFIKERYGEKNIVSARIHYDEKTPHMHVNFVPVTKDGRLCAKDLFKRADFSKLHDDFHKYCKERGYDLERGESKGDFKKHLSVEEYKIKTKQEDIEKNKIELDKVSNQLKKELNTLKNDLQPLKALQTNLNDLNIIKVKKSILGGKLTILEEDYNKLIGAAKEGLINSSELTKLKAEIKGLKEKNQEYEKAYTNKSKNFKELKKENKDLLLKVENSNNKISAVNKTLKDMDPIQREEFLDIYKEKLTEIEKPQQAQTTNVKNFHVEMDLE